ncbi:MAG: dihydrofolate reductase [Clostridiales bacterium]|jgi:dihydrofolate reductase|nr:dihydrofolate reductase [Clostridiales bacterium]
MGMKLIVAVDERWGIGRGNGLLFRIPEDMAFFRETTRGKAVVMGHGTLKSLPRSAPLAGRLNIVMSRDEALAIEGAITCNSVGQLAAALAARGICRYGGGNGNGNSNGAGGGDGMDSGSDSSGGSMDNGHGNGAGSGGGIDSSHTDSGNGTGASGTGANSGGGSDGISANSGGTIAIGSIAIGGDAYVIGGQSIYSLLLDYCDEALVTKIHADGRADRFFPDLDRSAGWAAAGRSEISDFDGLRYCFWTYRNKNAKSLPPQRY